MERAERRAAVQLERRPGARRLQRHHDGSLWCAGSSRRICRPRVTESVLWLFLAAKRLAKLRGFAVQLYASGFEMARKIITAPNGDIFLAESDAGRIRVLRGVKTDGSYAQMETFASELNRPFGIAFYPNGANPQYVYVGNTNSVVRFRYQNGDLKARGAPEIVVPSLRPAGITDA
jgi:hypothetical protein